MDSSEYSRPIEIYRAKGNLWICSWLCDKMPFDRLMLASSPFSNNKKISVPFCDEDLLRIYSLNRPVGGAGLDYYPQQLCDRTDDMLRGLPGLRETFNAYDPTIENGPQGVGLGVLQFSPNSLDSIIMFMLGHPYVQPLPMSMARDFPYRKK
jgi:hypothetical protein